MPPMGHESQHAASENEGKSDPSSTAKDFKEVQAASRPAIDIEAMFTYHPPTPEQQEQYKRIRDKAKELAQVIVDNTPYCADQSAALRHLREAVMTANASIAIPQPKR